LIFFFTFIAQFTSLGSLEKKCEDNNSRSCFCRTLVHFLFLKAYLSKPRFSTDELFKSVTHLNDASTAVKLELLAAGVFLRLSAPR
jgi:hypothetical protein